MSEVTEAHGSTGGVPEGSPVGNGDAEQFSGYLCGVCEEPLPFGAGACIACGTPVAPLDDEEMVAGPYVFGGPGTGEASSVPAEDPYAPAEDAPADRATFGPTTFDSADLPAADANDRTVTDAPAPPPTAPYAGESPMTNGASAPASEPLPVRDTEPPAAAAAPIEPPQPRRVPADPAEVLGIERPPYPAPKVADPGADPMLGRGPTAPVLAPPPPLPTADMAPSLPPPPGLGARDRGQRPEPSGSGPVTPLVVGAAVAVLALLALGAVIVSRGGEEPAATASTTTAPTQSAPPPTASGNRAQTTSTAAPGATALAGDFSEITSKPANVDTFCMAAVQFRIDPDPDSIAAKLLENQEQVVKTVVILVHHAPLDVKPTMQPLLDAVLAVQAEIESGDVRSVADIKAMQSPAWPRFDLPVSAAMSKHCQRYNVP